VTAYLQRAIGPKSAAHIVSYMKRAGVPVRAVGRGSIASPGMEPETAKDFTALEATPEAVDVAARFHERGQHLSSICGGDMTFIY
jgi:putative intracellular protease/amidase